VTPTSLDQTRTLLAQQHLIGLAPRPVDLLPMLRLGLLERLWTCEAADPGWEQAFATAGDPLETASGVRARWRGPDVDALLATAAAQVPARTSVLAAYTLTNRWRAAVEASPHLRLPTRTPARVPAQASEKIAMRSWLARLGVPVPESLVVDARQCDFGSLSRRLGPVVVLQDPHGSGGAGTERVASADDLEAAHRKHPQVRRWLASRWAGDTTINLHGLVPASGPVAVSAPSLQLSGIAEIGAGFGEYGGSDFGAPQQLINRTVIDQCTSLVRRIGLSLSGMGHVGLFGVDMAIAEGSVAVIEVNTRVQASTWLLGEGELEAGTVPMLCRHFLALTGLQTDGERPPAVAHMGCTLIVRHTGTVPIIAGSALQPGVYDLAAGLAWRRGGIGLLDCGPGEVVIGDLPRPGSLVEPGGTLARLTARTSVTTDCGRRLSAPAAAVVDEVRRRIGLSGAAAAVRAGT
jgi:hypothetical protein